jgi:type II secretory pathway component PulC
MATLSRLSFFWPFSWRGLSALILGVLLANWFWILFAPQTTFTAAVPEQGAGLEAGRLFGVVQSTDTATQGVALPNVQLLGVFAANAGKPGFAVLKLDDKRQVGVVEGEEVASGTKLVEVHADYVLLEHAGVQQKVSLENKYADASNKGVQPASGTAAVTQQNIDLQNRLRQLSK